MPDIVKVEYEQTGRSTNIDVMGMREMQAKAFAVRNEQYILIKAPPASGKSRALMFLGLDKLHHQHIKKVIVAVPEKSIGGSFSSVKLSDYGFFTDWLVDEHNNLCTPGGEASKVDAFKRFLVDDSQILICTHATLRFAFDSVEEGMFNDTLLAIDEFHHVSADADSRLGELVRSIMAKSSAHIIAMTGSYFRGDAVPVLKPEDEAKFTKVTYNYYEQLNGYTYLKSLGIGYHFYQGKYLSAIGEVLDTNRKTILHIPAVQAAESLKDKYAEVNAIIDIIGEVDHQDAETGVIFVKRKTDGKMIKIADLVQDSPLERDRIVAYLRSIQKPEDMDLVIALGMAKEGFDWPFCEHTLTVGYRGSLTEIIQIIGRCTRDSFNKTHAQFTNLVAAPDASDDMVKLSVNNMLKAITASLLMEQVLAPNFKFKTKLSSADRPQPGELLIKGFVEPRTERVKQILESDLNDLKARIFQDDVAIKAMPGNIDPEVLNKVLIPKIIRQVYPDLNEEQVEEVRQQVVVDSVIKNSKIKEVGSEKFVLMAKKFVNIDDLSIDLIDTVNPFQHAFEILSKSVTTHVLKIIQETIEATRIQMTKEEARILWPKIKEFVSLHDGNVPDINSVDPYEQRMGQAIIYLKNLKRSRMA